MASFFKADPYSVSKLVQNKTQANANSNFLSLAEKLRQAALAPVQLKPSGFSSEEDTESESENSARSNASEKNESKNIVNIKQKLISSQAAHKASAPKQEKRESKIVNSDSDSEFTFLNEISSSDSETPRKPPSKPVVHKPSLNVVPSVSRPQPAQEESESEEEPAQTTQQMRPPTIEVSHYEAEPQWTSTPNNFQLGQSVLSSQEKSEVYSQDSYRYDAHQEVVDDEPYKTITQSGESQEFYAAGSQDYMSSKEFQKSIETASSIQEEVEVPGEESQIVEDVQEVLDTSEVYQAEKQNDDYEYPHQEYQQNVDYQQEQNPEYEDKEQVQGTEYQEYEQPLPAQHEENQYDNQYHNHEAYGEYQNQYEGHEEPTHEAVDLDKYQQNEYYNYDQYAAGEQGEQPVHEYNTEGTYTADYNTYEQPPTQTEEQGAFYEQETQEQGQWQNEEYQQYDQQEYQQYDQYTNHDTQEYQPQIEVTTTEHQEYNQKTYEQHQEQTQYEEQHDIYEPQQYDAYQPETPQIQVSYDNQIAQDVNPNTLSFTEDFADDFDVSKSAEMSQSKDFSMSQVLKTSTENLQIEQPVLTTSTDLITEQINKKNQIDEGLLIAQKYLTAAVPVPAPPPAIEAKPQNLGRPVIESQKQPQASTTPAAAPSTERPPKAVKEIDIQTEPSGVPFKTEVVIQEPRFPFQPLLPFPDIKPIPPKDPTPILPLSAAQQKLVQEKLDFNPYLSMMNDFYREQLRLLQENMVFSMKMAQQEWAKPPEYKYTTLEATKAFIQKHKRAKAAAKQI